MKCPKCESDSKIEKTAVLETVVWRDRKCKRCGFLFTTSEMEDEPPVSVAGLRQREYRA